MEFSIVYTLLQFEVWIVRALACLGLWEASPKGNRLNPNLFTEFSLVNTSHPT
jgi:hypothetical protein